MKKNNLFKTKICHISTAHIAIASRLLHRECVKLSQAGYDVSLIAMHEKKFEIFKFVKIISFPKTNSRAIRMTIFNVYMLFKALKENCHLYHFHDPELLLVGYFLKLFGKKVIYDVHEDLPNQIYNKSYLPKVLMTTISTLIGFLENLFCKKFDGLITVVPTIQNRLLKANSNTIMFRNFPDIRLVDSAKILKKDKNFFTIIYPGSLSKKRGVEDAINLVNLYKGNIRLILAGNWESQTFQKKCKQLDGWKYVKFLGNISLQKIYSYIKSSDLGIHLIHDMPTSRIGYPIKAFEFMACKLPFLISDIGNKKKLFKNTCIYVKPGDLNDIKKKIDLLIKDKKYRKELGQNGRKKVIQLYNLDLEVNKLLKFYKNILKKDI